MLLHKKYARALLLCSEWEQVSLFYQPQLIMFLFYTVKSQKSRVNLGYIPHDISQIHIQFYYQNI